MAISQIICRAYRATTGSWLEIEIPLDISPIGDPDTMAQWVFEELDRQFVPLEFDIEHLEI